MTFEEYNKRFNIGSLRKILFDLGGTPGAKNKVQLIEAILSIENGNATPVRSNRGRPNRSVISTVADKERTSGQVSGVLEFVPEGYGFLRVENCYNSDKDAFVAKPTIKGNFLREGDYVVGKIEQRQENKLPELVQVITVNGMRPDPTRSRFDDITPIYPNKRFDLGEDLSMRVVDLFAPIGLGQRGLIVAPPKTGKTTLLKTIAQSIKENKNDVQLFVLLIDERPEEVTDFKQGLDCEVVASTFDCSPEHHVKVAELMMKRVKSLVESGFNVVLLMDSITKLVRAYNSVIAPSGKVLSGGVDPQALVMAKRLFGLARNTERGSLTILATALVETGSRMDDVIFEEFKGTGNMEIVLSRALAERRVFPAIDINRSGTRKEELLLDKCALDCSYKLRKLLCDNVSFETILDMMQKAGDNDNLVKNIDEWLRLAKLNG